MVEKLGKKTRDVRFYSEKNQKMMVVHSESKRAYTKYLEGLKEVEAYEVGKPMDEGRLLSVSHVDIRSDYFKQAWSCDFYIHYVDGTIGIREIIHPTDLDKRAEVEKLELSRRYWALLGISDWKVVILEK